MGIVEAEHVRDVIAQRNEMQRFSPSDRPRGERGMFLSLLRFVLFCTIGHVFYPQVSRSDQHLRFSTICPIGHRVTKLRSRMWKNLRQRDGHSLSSVNSALYTRARTE